MDRKRDTTAAHNEGIDEEHVTGEVGSEGGGLGNIEVEEDEGPLTGSDGTSTVEPQSTRLIEHRHDETGEGRRNP